MNLCDIHQHNLRDFESSPLWKIEMKCREFFHASCMNDMKALYCGNVCDKKQCRKDQSFHIMQADSVGVSVKIATAQQVGREASRVSGIKPNF